MITLKAPIESGDLYLWTYIGYLPRIIQYNSKGDAAKTKSFSAQYGSLNQGQVGDEFGNKGVTHMYIEGSADLSILAVPGLSFKTQLPKEYTSQTRSGYFYRNNVNLSAWYILPGSGKDGTYIPSNTHIEVLENSENRSVWKTYYSSGDLNETNSYEIVVPPVCYPRTARSATATIRVKTVRSDWAMAKFGWKTKVIESITTITGSYVKLGTVDSNIVVDLAALSAKICSTPLHFVSGPIVRESISDDIVSKVTIPDVNNCENLKDLKDIKKSIPPIADLLRKRNIKSVANLYLWHKYCYTTTKLDLKEYAKFIFSFLKDCRDNSDHRHISVTYTSDNPNTYGSVSQTTRYNIYTDAYNCGVIKALGLDLNMSNTWDLLPLSFVVDWFINFGDILHKLDSVDKLSEMKIRSVVTSNKCILNFSPLTDIGCGSNFVASFYSRTVSKTLPVAEVSVSFLNPIRHTTDGLALIISKKR